MVYTCLHAMRTGLLTRFWGSLGMALGAVSFIFFQFALLWFVYLGLLLLGRVPAAARPPGSRERPSPGRRRRRKRRPSSKGRPESSASRLPTPALGRDPAASGEPRAGSASSATRRAPSPAG